MSVHKALLIFLCLLGIMSLALFFLMRREQANFITTDGKRFTIMSLELPSDEAALVSIIQHLGPREKHSVMWNLRFDNVFTFTWYPFAIIISILSAQSLMRLMRSDHSPSNDSGQSVKVILIFLITAQVIAFILDRIENVHIMQWIKTEEVHTNLVMFKTMVWAKFLLTIPGAITAVLIWIISCRQWKRLKRPNISM